jgi:hypothetical protein
MDHLKLQTKRDREWKVTSMVKKLQGWSIIQLQIV